MQVGFKRITATARLPEYAHVEDDAGMDFFCDEYVKIYPQSSAIISTGVAWAPNMSDVPKGFKAVLKIESKSGLSCKHEIDKGAGVIDQTYTGEIKIHLYNHSLDSSYTFVMGDKVAQGIVEFIPIVEIVEVYEIEETNRGANGFGSTGK